MDTAKVVTDASDWSGTPVASLAPVESALRCQVCKEFYSTPMITTCAHTFCSLCIRRCLTNDGRCPACRTEDQPSRLRRNWVVEELVQAFESARPDILQLGKTAADAKREGEHASLKRKYDEMRIGGRAADIRRTTRSQTRKVGSSPSLVVHEIQDSEGEAGGEHGAGEDERYLSTSISYVPFHRACTLCLPSHNTSRPNHY